MKLAIERPSRPAIGHGHAFLLVACAKPNTAGFSSPRRQDERHDSERHSARKAIVLLALYASIQ
jgi:hypothetical protein